MLAQMGVALIASEVTGGEGEVLALREKGCSRQRAGQLAADLCGDCVEEVKHPSQRGCTWTPNVEGKS